MSPSNLSRFSRGDVVLVRFPFSDLTADKRRPAILVSDPAVVLGRDGHFVFMGSQPPPAGEPCIEIHRGSADATSMGVRFPQGKQTVFIRPRKIATLEVSLVARRIGTTPGVIMAELDAHLRGSLGL